MGKITKVIVKQDSDEAVEVLASGIQQIAESVERLRSGRLKEKALLVLISHASGQSQATVRAVLDGMQSIRQQFLK